MIPIATPLFDSRADAGRRLATLLTHEKIKFPIVYALPRGGVPVAMEVAHALEAPLDLILVRKLGVPGYPELAFGAVVNGAVPELVLNKEIVASARLSKVDIDKICKAELAEIDRRRALYFKDALQPDPSGRDVIIVDDGLATGATARAAIRALRRRGAARIILAIPVAPAEVIATLAREVDGVVCLETPEPFQAVGLWYREFKQLTDQEVINGLQTVKASKFSCEDR